MGEFAIFVFILFVAAWGSIGLAALLFGKNKAVDRGSNDALFDAIRDELDTISTRLQRIEDDQSFFNELHATEARPQLARPGESAPTTAADAAEHAEVKEEA